MLTYLQSKNSIQTYQKNLSWRLNPLISLIVTNRENLSNNALAKTARLERIFQAHTPSRPHEAAPRGQCPRLVYRSTEGASSSVLCQPGRRAATRNSPNDFRQNSFGYNRDGYVREGSVVESSVEFSLGTKLAK